MSNSYRYPRISSHKAGDGTVYKVGDTIRVSRTPEYWCGIESSNENPVIESFYPKSFIIKELNRASNLVRILTTDDYSFVIDYIEDPGDYKNFQRLNKHICLTKLIKSLKKI